MKNHLEICLRPIARGISNICSYTQKTRTTRGIILLQEVASQTKSALFQLLVKFGDGGEKKRGTVCKLR